MDPDPSRRPSPAKLLNTSLFRVNVLGDAIHIIPILRVYFYPVCACTSRVKRLFVCLYTIGNTHIRHMFLKPSLVTTAIVKFRSTDTR